jgi:hypothetical protein
LLTFATVIAFFSLYQVAWHYANVVAINEVPAASGTPNSEPFFLLLETDGQLEWLDGAAMEQRMTLTGHVAELVASHARGEKPKKYTIIRVVRDS